ncbi:MAG TPA: carbohydrate-binding protein [Deltaproteobacteria bacterium]|nr:carbohydrate-binding protein [Deltaproteobacteria bacterium]
MKRVVILLGFFLIFGSYLYGKSPSFSTYVNPVIPGDHPDPTLTKIGKYFYTSGSSFNPTPKIYRSTDLVHWEVIAQPVSASWTTYGDSPGGGIWGGHMVLYNGVYWHYFGKDAMYFVTADQPEGPWSTPTRVRVPASMPAGLGRDNSIFIDDDGKWYLLTKAGEPNNHIVELGQDGQPTGVVLNISWLNPAPALPYGWAEGPVMWKYNGYYYYSFAQHLVGRQYVMRSDTLTADKSAWTVVSSNSNMFTGPSGNFNTPNHISPAVLLDDGTSWVIAHSYHGTSWKAQGRQGLLCQVTYNTQGFPVIQYPSNNAVQAPNLPSSGIPWMVPKSDMFTNSTLKPEWSFLGYTPDRTWSLTEREGWLYLQPYGGSNTVIQNDGEHSYALITRVDFQPESARDEAGLWIINGPETHQAKVFSTVNSDGKNVLACRFQNTVYEVENTIGAIVWLKLIRDEHKVSGFYSADGLSWIMIGETINVAAIDVEQTQFNNFTGNQQGLYVKGKPAFFDLYIYRDAYTDIPAKNPANHFGVSPTSVYLGGIHNDDWALYAGIEFGNMTSPADQGVDYRKHPEQIHVIASSETSGGTVEVWLDSIDTGQKIAEVHIENTEGWNNYADFTASVGNISGRHDVYLRFKGAENEQLFRMKSFKFNDEQTISSIEDSRKKEGVLSSFSLQQNYPNPFNPSTLIRFKVPYKSFVSLKVTNLLGKEIGELAGKELLAGAYSVPFDASHLASGLYLYTLRANNFVETKKMFVIK